jgi:hypothetical protein
MVGIRKVFCCSSQQRGLFSKESQAHVASRAQKASHDASRVIMIHVPVAAATWFCHMTNGTSAALLSKATLVLLLRQSVLLLAKLVLSAFVIRAVSGCNILLARRVTVATIRFSTLCLVLLGV